MSQETRFCPNCGAEVTEGDVHCSRCGGKLRAGDATETPNASGATFAQGALIREYRVAGLLGIGGVGEVYRVQHVHTGQQLALKVLHAHMTANEGVRARFVQEGRALAQMNHPNVVKVYNLFEEGGRFFLVMDIVEGRALDSILEDSGPLPLEKAVDLTCDVLAALSHAHSRTPPLIHRDIKPANILVAENGSAVVTDFGIARFQGDKRFTQAGGVVGTPEYMSPEQVQGHDVGPAADLYSVGVLFYELLAGRVPFPQTGEVYWPVLKAHMEDPPPPLDVPGLPPWVQAAVDRALSKEAERRFADAQVFAEALRSAGKEESLEPRRDERRTKDDELPPPPPQPLPPSPVKTSGVPKWVLIVVGLVAVLSIILIAVGTQRVDNGMDKEPEGKLAFEKKAAPAPETPALEPVVTRAEPPGESSAQADRSPRARSFVPAPPAPKPPAPDSDHRLPLPEPEKPEKAKGDPPPCRPDCAGKDCGIDGCGGNCGTCGGGRVCRAARCVLDVNAVHVAAGTYPWHEDKKRTTLDLDGFCIDRNEVTYAEYEGCVRTGACDPIRWGDCIHLEEWKGKKKKETGRSRPSWHKDDHPVICASYQDAVDFCRSRGGSVPNTPQWEAAAGGPFGRTFPWGGGAPSDDMVNACGRECLFSWSVKSSWRDRHTYTAPPGSQPAGASLCGAQDMAGNVWEWTARPDGTLVWKGGAWNSNEDDLKVAQEYRNVKLQTRWNSAGFRCVYPESVCK